MGRALPVTGALRGGLLALLWTVAGCAAWQGPKPLQAWKAVGKSEEIVALDKAAHTLVAVQSKAEERRPDGRLALRVELANLSDKDLAIQVQTLFRDKAGVPTGEDTPFEPMVLPGMGSKIYSVVSLRPDAATYTIQVKTP